MAGIKWTKKQIELLKEHYSACNNAIELETIIGRKLNSIYYKANQLGIKRETNSGNKNLTTHGTAYRFKKGNQPWNKGLKGLQIGGKETQFKKGHIPHNTKYDGATRITVDGYIEQRVSMANWQLKHRLVWEEHKGKIPEGFIIKFKDGNKQNCSIENLYMCSKADNMNANTIHRYPDELKKSIRLINKLNKEVKK